MYQSNPHISSLAIASWRHPTSGNKVSPARAYVLHQNGPSHAKREKQTLSVAPSARSAMFASCLAHSAGNSPRASRDCKDGSSMLWKLEGIGDKYYWQSYWLLPMRARFSHPLMHILVPARRVRFSFSFVTSSFASPLLPFGMSAGCTCSLNGGCRANGRLDLLTLAFNPLFSSHVLTYGSACVVTEV